MNYLRRLVVVAGVSVVLAGCADLLGTEAEEDAGLAAEAQSFVTLVNEHREEQGLSALQWHSGLGDVAQAHSQDMHDRDFFDHTNLDGDDPFERMSAAGISYQAAAENIARGQSTGQAVLDSWLNSTTGHRENIENGNYTHHGLGYVADGNYWTHVFARNPSGE